MAEYFHQVNPLMIHRSAALDVDPFDRAVANANDEHPLGRHGYRRRRDEEGRPLSPRGPDHFGKHSRREPARRIGGADPGFGLASLRVEFGRAQTGEQLAPLYHRAAVDVYLLDEALDLRVNGRVLPCLQLAGEPNLAVEFERSEERRVGKECISWGSPDH